MLSGAIQILAGRDVDMTFERRMRRPALAVAVVVAFAAGCLPAACSAALADHPAHRP